ncbi:hypothetical protein FLW53_36405 [Microbispora sp. SCL1-1]|uniref:hypothetical protein n=1 Tax=unclassified Microbispora TaxID=2614687 RepID=UPI00115BB671|nr:MULTISPECIES: hypothetical protein [unclassified Microbispora]NJP29587.1 hypothetical protein [Microbispora sp. CL1-1]TQS04752.1 hypothetical protein FLW53_36405 [Microbispora sp. SCL1-1]
MTGFLDELGKKLAERWLTLLVLPGLIYLTYLAAALTLHQSGTHAFDVEALRNAIDRLATRPATASTAVIALAATAVLAAAAASGLAAAALGRLIERAWVIEGRRWPARLLTGNRQKRWKKADDRVHQQTKAAVRAHADPVAGPPAAELVRAITKRAAISLDVPQRPTWIGDRLRAVDQRLLTAYDLDLTSAWPRLWLTVPDVARTELAAARDAMAAAARLAGWALLYLLLAPWWWPALLIAAVIILTAWIRARTATAALADLIEATVDLYGRDLATQLGIPVPADGPLAPEIGLKITTILRKDPETYRPTS